MKKILLALILIPQLAISQKQPLSHDDSLDIRISDVMGKEYLKVYKEVSKQTVSITWYGNCEEIKIESDNGLYFPIIDTKNSNHIHLHNLQPGEYTILFFNNKKLLISEKIKT